MCLVISRCWPADHLDVLDHALHPDSAFADRVDLAIPTIAVVSIGLSALAPAQRAGGQRLRALALRVI
jgi:hypothetical protein